jgi:hypothetical protein
VDYPPAFLFCVKPTAQNLGGQDPRHKPNNVIVSLATISLAIASLPIAFLAIVRLVSSMVHGTIALQNRPEPKSDTGLKKIAIRRDLNELKDTICRFRA